MSRSSGHAHVVGDECACSRYGGCDVEVGLCGGGPARSGGEFGARPRLKGERRVAVPLDGGKGSMQGTPTVLHTPTLDPPGRSIDGVVVVVRSMSARVISAWVEWQRREEKRPKPVMATVARGGRGLRAYYSPRRLPIADQRR